MYPRQAKKKKLWLQKNLTLPFKQILPRNIISFLEKDTRRKQKELRPYYVPSTVGTLYMLPHSSKQPHTVCIAILFQVTSREHGQHVAGPHFNLIVSNYPLHYDTSPTSYWDYMYGLFLYVYSFCFYILSISIYVHVKFSFIY